MTAPQWIEELYTLGVIPSDLSRGVALVGDSLAVGLTGPLTQQFSDTKFTAASKGGTAINQWLSGFMSGSLNQVLADKPGVVLISLGTNDTAPASQPNAATIRERVLELVARVRAAGAVPVWLMPGPLPWKTDALRAAVNESATTTIEQPTVSKPDGVHPSSAGYKTWAEEIARSLKTSQAPAGVSRGGGLVGGIIIIAAALGLLWATLNVRGRRADLD